jgi:cytochrome c
MFRPTTRLRAARAGAGFPAHMGVAATAWLALIAADGVQGVLFANEAPSVSIHVGTNQSFLVPGEAVSYVVVVSDAEDGDTLAGSIDVHRVAVTFARMASGYERFTPPALDERVVLGATWGRALIAGSDCVVCHFESSEIPQAIPTFTDIANRFQGNLDAAPALAFKIVNGSKLAWGDIPMPAHPDFGRDEATAIAYYVLSFAGAEHEDLLPVSGSVEPELSGGRDTRFGYRWPGRYVLAASYTDSGDDADGARTGYAVEALRYPNVFALDNDGSVGMKAVAVGERDQVLVSSAARAYLTFRGVDLSNIDHLTVSTWGSRSRWSGGRLDFRLDSPSGTQIGTALVTHDSDEPAVHRTRTGIQRTFGHHDLYAVISGDDSVALGSICFGCDAQ